jgi:pimeloyl-ACP methyl ester carboxylesterase
MTTNNTSDAVIPDTIVLIHGLWLTPRSWEHWVDRYERFGYRVIAPS